MYMGYCLLLVRAVCPPCSTRSLCGKQGLYLGHCRATCPCSLSAPLLFRSVWVGGDVHGLLPATCPCSLPALFNAQFVWEARVVPGPLPGYLSVQFVRPVALSICVGRWGCTWATACYLSVQFARPVPRAVCVGSKGCTWATAGLLVRAVCPPRCSFDLCG